MCDYLTTFTENRGTFLGIRTPDLEGVTSLDHWTVVNNTEHRHPAPETVPSLDHLVPETWGRRRRRRGSSTRRSRVHYTPDQLAGLTRRYGVTTYITMDERAVLARELGLQENQVKVWFQNRRRIYRDAALQQQGALVYEQGDMAPRQEEEEEED